MDPFLDPAYVPILRTRDAELKGIRNLDADSLQAVLPVMEFTRSRRGKNNPEGSVRVCVDQVQQILGDGMYIADVTTLAALSSNETQALLSPARSFQTWRRFARTLGSNCIPVVHLTDPFDADITKEQATDLMANCGLVAVRIPPRYEYVDELVQALTSALGTFKNVVLICDAGFLSRANFQDRAYAAAVTLMQFGALPFKSVAAGSCFPSSVVLPEYGRDAYGKFPLLEVAMSEYIREQKGLKHVLHGDYALVYPEDVTGTVTNWVPRVDVPLDTQVFYHRYRRGADGGYVKAAQMAFADPDYQPLPCWGHTNIVEAARGAPQGKGPAHWIAVRVNYHITRQVARLT